MSVIESSKGHGSHSNRSGRGKSSLERPVKSILKRADDNYQEYNDEADRRSSRHRRDVNDDEVLHRRGHRHHRTSKSGKSESRHSSRSLASDEDLEHPDDPHRLPDHRGGSRHHRRSGEKSQKSSKRSKKESQPLYDRPKNIPVVLTKSNKERRDDKESEEQNVVLYDVPRVATATAASEAIYVNNESYGLVDYDVPKLLSTIVEEDNMEAKGSKSKMAVSPESGYRSSDSYSVAASDNSSIGTNNNDLHLSAFDDFRPIAELIPEDDDDNNNNGDMVMARKLENSKDDDTKSHLDSAKFELKDNLKSSAKTRSIRALRPSEAGVERAQELEEPRKSGLATVKRRGDNKKHQLEKEKQAIIEEEERKNRSKSSSRRSKRLISADEMERAREKEREKAEEVEREIRRRRNEYNNQRETINEKKNVKSSSNATRMLRFADLIEEQNKNDANNNDLSENGNNKNCFKSDYDNAHNKVVGDAPLDNDGKAQTDRCFDVYNETVRQRMDHGRKTAKRPSISHEHFDNNNNNNNNDNNNDNSNEKNEKKEVKEENGGKESNGNEEMDEDSMSVRELLSKFEQPKMLSKKKTSSPNSKLAATFNTNKNFAVMSSLTRRGASQYTRLLNPNKETQSIKEETLITAFGLDNNENNVNNVNNESSKKVVAVMNNANKAKVERKGSVASMVAKLYLLPLLNDDAKNSPDAAVIKAVLERLPTDKKRATSWHTWKKQLFVADRGYLYVYSVKSEPDPEKALERFELFGGRVKIEEEKIVVVHDRKGHFVGLRCNNREEAMQWEKIITLHTQQDFTRTFVKPVSSISPSHLTDVLIVDLGGSSVRAGVATKIPTLPQVFFPSVMAQVQDDESAIYFGLNAFADEIRCRSRLSRPLMKSTKANITAKTLLLSVQGLLEQVLKNLSVDPSMYQLQLSVGDLHWDESSTKSKLLKMLFEEFGLKSVNVCNQSTLAFRAYNASTGIMVDLGERMSVVPIIDNYIVSAGSSSVLVGAQNMRDKLQHLLLGKNPRMTGSSLVDDFVIRSVAEKTVFLAQEDFDLIGDQYRREPERFDVNLEVRSIRRGVTIAIDDDIKNDNDNSDCSDVEENDDEKEEGKILRLRLGSERFESVEGLFKPELWGLDQAGVHVLVHKAIKECSVDIRKELGQSIFLAGGLTLIGGFRERLEFEVAKLANNAKIRVHASPYRYHAAYLGANQLASVDKKAFDENKVTREQWIRQQGNR